MSLGSVALRKMSGSRFVDGAEQPHNGDRTALLGSDYGVTLQNFVPCNVLTG